MMLVVMYGFDLFPQADLAADMPKLEAAVVTV
jgi:hypothetical protein